ncbi:uncharacterized protein LOC120337694 [Styela clava]
MDSVKYLYLLLSVILVFQTIVRADNDDHGHEQTQTKLDELASMEGHMKPLGSVGPYFKLFTIEGFPSSPREFFNKYVIPSTPVVMKNAAKISPAFTKWTDSYFISHPESDREEIFAEGRKKEIRTEPGSTMTFKQFVELYNTTDMYMVHGLPKHLKPDVIIPPPMQCDPVMESMLDVVTWFSSGGTKSVLHNDDVDNLNCLYRGNKTLVFLNPHDHDNIWRNLIDRTDGGYSSMDVDAVDYTKFPDLAKVRYSKVDMQAGDCLFIPYGWYHQVNSFGSNLAVNLWWKHRPQQFFDLTEEVCGDFTGRNTIANISYPGMDEAEDGGGGAYSSAPEGGSPTKEEFLKRYNTENKTEDDKVEKETEVAVQEKTQTDGQPISYSDDYEAPYLDPEHKEEEVEAPPVSEEDTGEGPYIQQEEQSLADKIYRAILRIKKPVKMSGLKKYVLKKMPETLQTWDDRCQEILINFFGLLDQNKDTELTILDAELFYDKDDNVREQLLDASAFFEEDLRHSLNLAGANKERELVQKLLDRGELDKEQIATIFGNKLVMPAPSQHGKDEL